MSGSPNAASVAIFSGAEVLLVKRAANPFMGYWTLPGGRLEKGETAMDCARREIDEELGLALDVLVPVSIINMQPSSQFVLAVFAARIARGCPVPSNEIQDWRWVLPGEVCALRTTPALEETIFKAIDVLTLV